MTCSISSSAFNYIREHLFGESSFHLFDEDDEELEGLKQLIKADEPTEATLRLRCFFAIECAVYIALKASFASADTPELAERLSEALPIERSHEGLTRLLLVLEGIEGSLRADQVEYRFMGDYEKELGGLNAKLLEKPKTLVSYIIRMVKILRPGLTKNKVLGDSERAGEIGEFMARTLIDTFPDPATCFYWLRRLLHTSMENPSTWNATKASLV